MPRSQDFHGIAEHLRSAWDLRQKLAVRAAEAKLAVGLSIELVALLVNGAIVPTTEQRKIRERGRASLCPVMDVMSLAESHSAAREAAAAVSVVERPS
jgi:sulfur carrier protein ThiS